MTDPCAVCTELGRPCTRHQTGATPTSKLSPPQNALLRRLERGPVPIGDCHALSLESLMRRRLATVEDGHAVLVTFDGPDAA